MKKTIFIKIKVDGDKKEIALFKEDIESDIIELLENYNLGYEEPTVK